MTLFEKDTSNVNGWIWLPLIVLCLVLGLAYGAWAQDNSSEEKIIMSNFSANRIPPLDLQAPTVTETASFALG